MTSGSGSTTNCRAGKVRPACRRGQPPVHRGRGSIDDTPEAAQGSITVTDRSSKWRVLRVASDAPVASAMPAIMLSRNSTDWPALGHDGRSDAGRGVVKTSDLLVNVFC